MGSVVSTIFEHNWEPNPEVWEMWVKIWKSISCQFAVLDDETDTDSAGCFITSF